MQTWRRRRTRMNWPRLPGWPKVVTEGPTYSGRRLSGGENDFKNSEEFNMLKMFTKRKTWRSDYADCETWACKHARKAHYKKCPRLVKLEFLGASKTVIMLDNSEDHNHAIDADYGGGRKY